jgi:hypothetical protein
LFGTICSVSRAVAGAEVNRKWRWHLCTTSQGLLFRCEFSN